MVIVVELEIVCVKIPRAVVARRERGNKKTTTTATTMTKKKDCIARTVIPHYDMRYGKQVIRQQIEIEKNSIKI